MTPYSQERKQAVLSKFLPPHSMSIAAVAREENISEQTLYNWRKQQQQPAKTTPITQGQPVPTTVPLSPASKTKNWTNQTKLATVSATLNLSQLELAEYCRTRGLHIDQIEQWKAQLLSGFSKTDQQTTASRQQHQAKNE